MDNILNSSVSVPPADPPGTDSLEIQFVSNKGRGVFAKKTFSPGDRIERAPVIPLTKEEEPGDNMPTLYHYVYGWGRNNVLSALVLGYGSLYNHSYTPNAYYVRNLSKDTIDYIALKPIEIGEEITVNYNGVPNDKSPLWFEVH